MAQNVTINGATYSDVPAIQTPKSGGGIATFTDTSDADATASDILKDKTAYVNGQKVTGTYEGGGGGLQYETGSVSMSGQYFTINHNLNTTKTIVFFELADLSNVPNTLPISGLCGTSIFGTGQTSAGHTINTHNYTGYCRSSSTAEVKYSVAYAVTSGITTSKVVVDTGINSATNRTYNYVVIAMP